MGLRDKRSAPGSLHALYGSSSVRLVGAGWSGRIGLGTVGRRHSLAAVSGLTEQSANAARYGSAGISESFAPVRGGIDQSFTIAQRPLGSGPVRIDVPLLSGLTTSGSGGVLEVHDSSGASVGSYRGLHVTDATGRVMSSTMDAAAGGRTVLIDVDDAGAVYPLHVDPTWSQTAELTASDEAAGNQLGTSVAISGSVAVVGAPDHQVGSNAGQGAAYVYTLSAGSWSQTAELTASDGAAFDSFGASVAISGSVAVVGAPNHEVSSNAEQGAAYVYTLSGGSWSQTAELTASDGAAFDNFGFSVALSGSTAVVGAPAGNTASGHGEAYVFTLSGSSWPQTAQLTASDGAAGDAFGYSVGLSGSVAVVGALDHQVSANAQQGVAYIYTLVSGTWTQTTELTASDGAANDHFGTSVSVSGSTAVVGAPEHAVGSNAKQGAAYVYTVVSGTWSQTAELNASNGLALYELGQSVAIDSTTIVVGEHGGSPLTAYVYTLSGRSWSQGAELIPSDANPVNDGFSWSVALSGSTAIVGAATQVENSHQSGAAYIFTAPVSASQLVITSSALSGLASSTANLGPATVTLEDAVGDPVTAGAGGLMVNLSSTSTGGTFSATQNGTPIASISIASGNSTATFYYGDTSVGAPTVTAAATGLTSGTQIETISSSAPMVSGLSPNSGPTGAGAVVTITGSNLSGATAVHFGAAAAHIDTVSADEIQATSPAGSGTVDVTVTTAHGTSVKTTADHYSYVAAPRVSKLSPNRGPTGGGMVVTITGSNLAGATAVDFGSAAADIDQTVSATEIKVTSPAGSGVVDVTVTTAGGTSVKTTADHYTYVVAPTVSGLSPNSGPTGGGRVVTITGSNLTGATAVHFGSAAAHIDLVSASEIKATSPAGSGAVDVTVTTAGGTSAETTADQYSYVVAPIVSGLSPNRGPAVGGTVVTITGSNLAGATAVHFGAAVAHIDTVSASEVQATSPAGSGAVDVTVTTAGGTSVKTTADRYSYVVAPRVSRVSLNSGPAVGGTVVTITGSNLAGATEVDFGGAAAEIDQTVSATEIKVTSPAGSGTVDVTVTTAGGTSVKTTADRYTYVVAPRGLAAAKGGFVHAAARHRRGETPATRLRLR